MTLEHWISRAEIAYKSGHVAQSIRYAKSAIRLAEREHNRAGTVTALRIFIARAHSKLGQYHQSNVIYRQLINEQNYLPPVIMGLLYNSCKQGGGAAQKMSNNLGLIKIFVR